MPRMAMGTRENDQTPLWVATSDLPSSPGHPFYTRLNAILDAERFDRFVEDQCRRFYAPVMGRPSLAPGRYFRLLLIGYFEGIDAARGIAVRAADSLALRTFLRLGLEEGTPDHSTISRTRRLIDVETHRAVFTWVQERLVAAGLLKGRTIAIDATTLEANAAMRSIVRRDTGESYQAFLTRLAKASGLKTPTRAALARLDRRRKKRTSNTDWETPSDPNAKITKMKDGRTHLAHKAEHAVDLATGALVAVTVQCADLGDTSSLAETVLMAAEQLHPARPSAKATGQSPRGSRRAGGRAVDPRPAPPRDLLHPGGSQRPHRRVAHRPQCRAHAALRGQPQGTLLAARPARLAPAPRHPLRLRRVGDGAREHRLPRRDPPPLLLRPLRPAPRGAGGPRQRHHHRSLPSRAARGRSSP